MRTSNPIRISALLATAILCVLPTFYGCGGGDPVDPGDGPDPVIIQKPELAARRLIDASTLDILDMAPTWTDDDRWILFNAGPGSIVWKVDPDGGADPQPVTDPEYVHWILGGYAPFALEDGAIGYFQGVLPGSYGMHLMSISQASVAGSHEAEIVRTFSGTSIGLPENQISSPRMLSMDVWARRGVGVWRSTWFLDWQESESGVILVTRPATGIEDATDFRISRDGEWVAYRDGQGIVTWIPFNAEEAHPLGPGRHPSFSGDGSRIGFVALNGHDYVVHRRDGGAPVVYNGVDLFEITSPVLSRAGDRIAFLSEDEEGVSLFVGRLEL
jgi:hypothetical protein